MSQGSQIGRYGRKMEIEMIKKKIKNFKLTVEVVTARTSLHH